MVVEAAVVEVVVARTFDSWPHSTAACHRSQPQAEEQSQRPVHWIQAWLRLLLLVAVEQTVLQGEPESEGWVVEEESWA